MFKDLKNKNIYIIGGSGLIGSNLTKKLSKLSKKIIVIDNKLKKNTSKIKYLNFDINNQHNLESRLKKIFNTYGNPNVMINCSYPKNKNWDKLSFQNFNQKDIDENLNLHLKSFLNYSLNFAHFMKKYKIKGSIINLSSIYGLRGQKADLYNKRKTNPIYPLIKSSIIGSDRQFAAFFGKYQIRFNSVCPGGIILNKKNLITKKFVKKYLQINPIKRMCRPDDVSNAIIFLSSDMSSYITGTNIIVDGGWTAV